MSDSDDTDILLLIPPNFFVQSAEKELQKQQKLHGFNIAEKIREQFTSVNAKMENEAIGGGLLRVDEFAKTTAAYKFLPSEKKAELNEINSRLLNLDFAQQSKRNNYRIDQENFDDMRVSGEGYFAAPSDISTISNNTVRTHGGLKHLRHVTGLVHSTPKSQMPPGGGNNEPPKARDYQNVADGDVLLEIDNFLEDRHVYNRNDYKRGNNQQYRLHHSEQDDPMVTKFYEGFLTKTNSCPNTLLFDRKLQESKGDSSNGKLPFSSNKTNPLPSVNENHMISLSQIYGQNGQATVIPKNCDINDSATLSFLKEEQLRRQHLEKTVSCLQTKLLEYQQRLSVAIEVDRAKEETLNQTVKKLNKLKIEMDFQHELVDKLKRDQCENMNKIENFQKELTQAVNLATKFQEKNEKLEATVNDYEKKFNEYSNVYKKEAEELEIKLYAAQRSEDFSNLEMHKFKDKLVKAEYKFEKLKVQCEEQEEEIATLKQQKETLHEFQQKQKARADKLESQKNALQDTISELTKAEANLTKKMDIQQKSLKTYYQQQLENIVAQKLKEFQEELDKTEETLKTEARDRERLIAERAVKQLELIVEKNELENNLLQEKHNEEVELYRIQLANASKKIDELELKLNSYRNKRADIAEKLHNVMEAQWQKTVKILTSPNTPVKAASDSEYDYLETSPDNNETAGQPKQKFDGQLRKTSMSASTVLYHETPKINKMTKISNHSEKENNLNVINQDDDKKEQKTSAKVDAQEEPPHDKLEAYIELLLSTAPGDIEKLDEILCLTKASRMKASEKRNKSKKTKRPWKA